MTQIQIMDKHEIILAERIFEVELHYKRPLFDHMLFINSVDEAVRVFRSCFHPLKMDLQESFWVLYLSQAHRLLGAFETGIGNSVSVLANPKAIFQMALKLNASAILVAHNHPSGGLKVSDRDKKLTRKIATVAKIMDIILTDHIILTSEGFISFAEEGLL